MLIRITLFLSIALVTTSQDLYRNEIKLGGLFHTQYEDAELAFRAAIYTFNAAHKKIRFIPLIQHIPPKSSFKTEKALCEMIAEGVAGVFGPFTKETIGITGSICDKYKIPHFIVQWTPESVETLTVNRSMTINMYPDSNLLSKALSELVVDNDWKKYFVLYENDDGLMRLKDSLQIHGPSDRPIIVRQLDKFGDYRPLLKKFQASTTDIILDCNLDNMIKFLYQAKELDMLGEYNRYILAPLDSHTLFFDDLMNGNTNITLLRIADSNNGHAYARALSEINQYREQHNLPNTNNNFRLDVILMYDAVKYFGNILSDLNSQEKIDVPNMDCHSYTKEQWGRGMSIRNKLKSYKFTGITGPIIIDSDGSRKHFQLDIIELTDTGFRQIGNWTPNGIQHTVKEEETQQIIVKQISQKTFRVVSKYGDPFLMKRDPPENGSVWEGNDRFEGFVVDFVYEISQIYPFKYEIEVVPDGNYGNFDKDKQEWNGIVRHIMQRKADMGVADLTVTYERKTAVDFTVPYITLGISILYAKAIPDPPDLFSFLSPFAFDVWIYTATAYLIVSLLLFILSRMEITPEEEDVEIIYNLQNSTWTTIGSILAQGSDILPVGISTRIICALWWSFALIMLSSYTANMAAFLTMERIDKSIESVEDLSQQTNIKYGAVLGGSTAAFFKTSNNSLYKKMWTVMEQASPTVFPKTNAEGIERVVKSKKTYAFFVESSILEYIIERNCNLTRIGQNLDSKGYAIALPLNSLYRKPLNSAILKLQENGKLEAVKKKWWKEAKGGGLCNTDKKVHDETSELGVENVGGVFLVLLAGCVVGLFIGVIEFLWNVKEIAVDEDISLCDSLKRELKFVVSIRKRTKPVYKTLQPSE